MDLGTAGLTEQPFPKQGKPHTMVRYSAVETALYALHETLQHPRGLAMLQGPPLSGKSTVLREFLGCLPEQCCAAVLDGKNMDSERLLTALLARFGFDLEPSSTNELLGLVRVFALQQTATHDAPLLVIENAQELRASALRTLKDLAELRVRQTNAVKLVLVSDVPLRPIVGTPALNLLAKRSIQDIHMRPMNRPDVTRYLHHKLIAAGCKHPENLFPAPICGEVWQKTGGWPGLVDRIALLALAQSSSLPVGIDSIGHPEIPLGTWDASDPASVDVATGEAHPPPALTISKNGTVITELTLEGARAIVGRSRFNDVSLDSRFVSLHHALLVRHGRSTILMDLNSANGTFVNSRRISNHVLMHNDVITLGHHHIKFSDPSANTPVKLADIDFRETAVMKTLEDKRAQLAEENPKLVPGAPDKTPTFRR